MLDSSPQLRCHDFETDRRGLELTMVRRNGRIAVGRAVALVEPHVGGAVPCRRNASHVFGLGCGLGGRGGRSERWVKLAAAESWVMGV